MDSRPRHPLMAPWECCHKVFNRPVLRSADAILVTRQGDPTECPWNVRMAMENLLLACVANSSF